MNCLQKFACGFPNGNGLTPVYLVDCNQDLLHPEPVCYVTTNHGWFEEWLSALPPAYRLGVEVEEV